MKRIPYGTQSLSFSDRLKVFRALKSNWLTQGPTIQEFEKQIAKKVNAKFAVAVCNGTAALHLINLAVGYEKNEIGLTSTNTFLASANGIIYAGGTPQFIDIQTNDYNLDFNQIKADSKNIKTIIPVHFAGFPVNIKSLKEKFPNLIIIEDAAHALGSKFKDGENWVSIGSCKYSLATIFSFHPVKHITTGEGGLITTNDEELASKLQQLRSHGISISKKTKDPWYYEMTDLGFNYRITDFQCALGISQLKKLDKFVIKRRKIAKIYQQAFKNIQGLNFPIEQEWQYSSYHLFTLLIDFPKFNITRRDFMNKLKKKGIITQVHYIPIYKQPYYKKCFNYADNNFPNTEKYYNQTISIPLYPKMKNSDVRRVIKEIKTVLNIS